GNGKRAVDADLPRRVPRRHAVLFQLRRRRAARRARSERPLIETTEGPVRSKHMATVDPTSDPTLDPLLDVKHLDVRFSTPDGEVHAVKNLSFEIARDE